jgi:hypothetical protein
MRVYGMFQSNIHRCLSKSCSHSIFRIATQKYDAPGPIRTGDPLLRSKSFGAISRLVSIFDGDFLGLKKARSRIPPLRQI